MTSCSDKIVKGEVLSFTLDTDLGQLDDLHEMVECFCNVHGLENKTIFEANLAFEEIFTNIVSYGHDDKKRHQVHFTFECKEDNIIIRIEDDGVPFNLLDAEPVDLDADLEHRTVGGLGIHLVRKFMDDVSYERIGTVNVLTLQKRCCKKEER